MNTLNKFRMDAPRADIPLTLLTKNLSVDYSFSCACPKCENMRAVIGLSSTAKINILEETGRPICPTICLWESRLPPIKPRPIGRWSPVAYNRQLAGTWKKYTCWCTAQYFAPTSASFKCPKCHLKTSSLVWSSENSLVVYNNYFLATCTKCVTLVLCIRDKIHDCGACPKHHVGGQPLVVKTLQNIYNDLWSSVLFDDVLIAPICIKSQAVSLYSEKKRLVILFSDVSKKYFACARSYCVAKGIRCAILASSMSEPEVMMSLYEQQVLPYNLDKKIWTRELALR